MAAKLNLFVIRAGDLDRTVAFYTSLGMNFVQEQHGTGPQHFACSESGMVLEIYPASAARPTDTSTRLGVSVSDPAAVLLALEAAGARIVSPLSSSPWGLRAVVEDPDGRHVELTAAAV